MVWLVATAACGDSTTIDDSRILWRNHTEKSLSVDSINGYFSVLPVFFGSHPHSHRSIFLAVYDFSFDRSTNGGDCDMSHLFTSTPGISIFRYLFFFSNSSRRLVISSCQMPLLCKFNDRLGVSRWRSYGLGRGRIIHFWGQRVRQARISLRPGQ